MLGQKLRASACWADTELPAYSRQAPTIKALIGGVLALLLLNAGIDHVSGTVLVTLSWMLKPVGLQWSGHVANGVTKSRSLVELSPGLCWDDEAVRAAGRLERLSGFTPAMVTFSFSLSFLPGSQKEV